MYKQLAPIYYDVDYILGKHFVLKMFLYSFSRCGNVCLFNLMFSGDGEGNGEGGGSNLDIYSSFFKYMKYAKAEG